MNLIKTLLIVLSLVGAGTASTAIAGGILTHDTVVGEIRFCTYNGYTGGYTITVPAYRSCPVGG